VFIRKSLDLTKGSIVLAKIVDNTVVLVPQRTIDKDQIWFWTERWQKLEAEAEKDIRKGRVKTFNSVEELFEKLKKQLKLLVSDPRSPSLRVKKIKGTKSIFEARVNDSYRFTFEFGEESEIILRVHNDALKKP